jgi:hypothetical protein
MARPHIEFIHSGQIPWTKGFPDRPRVDGKLLSRDDSNGGFSALFRYPAGWRQDDRDLMHPEEFLVLKGELIVDGQAFGLHHYAYRPAREGGRWSTRTGAVVLTFAEPGTDEAPLHVDTLALPWDTSHMDPGVRYLNMGRKNLRHWPGESGRTYLLAGMPQVMPPDGKQGLERHPYPEEAFMIAGDLTLTNGVLRQGGYFWQPPGKWHGGMASVAGFLMLVRTPGSDAPIVEWSRERLPVSLTPTHAPILAAGMIDSGPLADPLEY